MKQLTIEKEYEKIALKLAREIYPEDNKDWSERHKALAFATRIFVELEKKYSESIIELIEPINETNPAYESDNYDRGRKDMKEEIINTIDLKQTLL